MEWIPAMGGLVVADSGRIALYTPSTNSWSSLASGLNFGYSNFLQYIPLLGLIVFGGGPATPNKMFKMTIPGAVVTALPDSPFVLGTTSPTGAVVTHDPNTGLMLVLPQSGQFSQFNPTTAIWTTLPTSPIYTGNGAGNTQAVPIPEYGVTFWIVNKQTEWGASRNNTYLYKHSPTQGDTTPPAAPLGFKIIQ